MSMEKRVEIGESVNADPIRNGLPTNVKTEFGAGHPVEELINTTKKSNLRTRRQMLAATYGSHLPLQMMMEEQILSSFHRLPGLKSEYIGLETLARRDVDIDYEDIYGNPEDSPELPTTDLHSEMEKRLHLIPK